MDGLQFSEEIETEVEELHAGSDSDDSSDESDEPDVQIVRFRYLGRGSVYFESILMIELKHMNDEDQKYSINSNFLLHPGFTTDLEVRLLPRF